MDPILGTDGHPLPTLPHLAAAIAVAFPDLNGRAVVVTDVEETPENIPTLPLVMLAPQNEDYVSPERSNASTQLEERIICKFFMESVRVKHKVLMADGSEAVGESPFWAYYDTWKIRNALFAMLQSYRSPATGRVRPVRMDVGADAYAVEITFTLSHKFLWCAPDVAPAVPAGQSTIGLLITPAPYPECCVCSEQSTTTAATDDCP